MAPGGRLHGAWWGAARCIVEPVEEAEWRPMLARIALEVTKGGGIVPNRRELRGCGDGSGGKRRVIACVDVLVQDDGFRHENCPDAQLRYRGPFIQTSVF